MRNDPVTGAQTGPEELVAVLEAVFELMVVGDDP